MSSFTYLTLWSDQDFVFLVLLTFVSNNWTSLFLRDELSPQTSDEGMRSNLITVSEIRFSAFRDTILGYSNLRSSTNRKHFLAFSYV